MENLGFELKAKHKKFLEVFLDTFDFAAAIAAAQISKATGEFLVRKYQNLYRAIFEKIGLTDDDVMKEIKKLILNPEEMVYDKLRGKFMAYPDNKIRLAAIRQYCEITGAVDNTITVRNESGSEDKDVALFKKLKASAKYKELQAEVLRLMDNPGVDDAKKE